MPNKATLTTIGVTVVAVLIALFVAGLVNRQFPDANIRP